MKYLTVMTDKELFKGAAQSYAKYRLGYSRALFNHLVKSFELDNTKRVLDLGTGTGQLAIPLAAYVQEVVALDPDKEMLEGGKMQAERQGVFNIKWIQSRAEDITGELGIFRLTTMGASFHWMDQDAVLSKVYDFTEGGGGIAIGANNSTIINNIGKDPWKDIAWTTIKEFLGEERRAGTGYYNKPKDRFEDVIARSKFSNLQVFKDTWTAERTIDDIFGYLASTSFAAPRLFGDTYEEFKNLLTARLLGLNPSGIFIETAVLEMYLAWKS